MAQHTQSAVTDQQLKCLCCACATKCIPHRVSRVRLIAAITSLMADDPQLWQRRPLSSQLQQYAAADVSPLLSLADILASKLGEVGQSTVIALSQTSSQLKLPIKVGTQVAGQYTLLDFVCVHAISWLCT